MQPTHRLLAVPAVAALLSPLAAAQNPLQFSIDWRSSSHGVASCGGAPITAGDILSACPAPGLGPLATPRIVVPGGPGGLGLATHPGCVGSGPGVMCGVEVDALSSGDDAPFKPDDEIQPGSIYFSVDEFSGSLPGTPVLPNIVSERPSGDSGADVMVGTSPLPWGPFPPVGPGPFGHTGVLDGDGTVSASGYTYPGLGLQEGVVPAAGPVSGADNLDCFNILAPGTTGPLYFSLDATPNLFDPCLAIGGTESALRNGFLAGDVLVQTATGPALYASAGLLGLNLVGGPDSDDLDALLLTENGVPGYQVSSNPYDWLAGATDMLVFSVRRSSRVVGQPDSVFGVPIEPGDLLIPPVSGGVSPFPGIFIPAEALGLRTARSGSFGPCGSADIDALEHELAAIVDCNGNGIEDAVEIADGSVVDANRDGVPDVCGLPPLIVAPYCFCPVGICGNPDATAGCANSTSNGALLSASGSTSVGLDDLVLTATQLPPFQFGIFFRGTTNPMVPFGDGFRCVGGTIRRTMPMNSGAAGVISIGPGLVAGSASGSAPINPGSTWYIQAWYRDGIGPCGTGFNTSNALGATFY